MTLSLSDKGGRVLTDRMTRIYLGVTGLCLVFFLVYDRFSHGVRSPFMTYLFAWPLLLGLLPCAARAYLEEPRPGLWPANLYHAGVAAVTVSSLLKGIFDIAGTSSDYQAMMMVAGLILMLAGIRIYIQERRRLHGDSAHVREARDEVPSDKTAV